ncbi:hypothetical protein [Actinoplanes sp. NPDC026670]|uniref:hypothetical protein n=1 Tax=Actinoplanes sp. NPDC026670 TaxID=3154700 RepID=UPI003403D0D3
MKNDFVRQPEHPGFISSEVPPVATGNYLLRRRQTTRQTTWTEVDEAMAWLVMNYESRPPNPILTYEPLQAKVEHSRDGLLNGADAVWHYALAGWSVLVMAVICCPHRHHTTTPCPLPPN